MARRTKTRKTYAFITPPSDRDDPRYVVFREPDTGDDSVQLPGGTVDLGESLDDAVLREAFEETGLTPLRIAARLGVTIRTKRGRTLPIEDYYYHLIWDAPPAAPIPERWFHHEMTPSAGGPPIRFELWWADARVDSPLTGRFREFVPGLRATLGVQEPEPTPEPDPLDTADEPPVADAPPSPLVARDREVLWHPCSQQRDYDTLPPLPIATAEGSWLILDDGRRVLDAIASWWCKSLGHRHPVVMNAIRAQTEQLDHVILANTTHAGVVDLSERLLALANRETPAAVVGAGEATREARSGRGAPTPRRADPAWHFGKAMYASDGSTGIEIALKLALHAQQHLGHQERTTYAVLAGGYHGETTGALSV
jgi:8-oxo-dGTP pyrophosphatase MutT (NUDIX family)